MRQPHGKALLRDESAPQAPGRAGTLTLTPSLQKYEKLTSAVEAPVYGKLSQPEQSKVHACHKFGPLKARCPSVPPLSQLVV